jgi:hypothetical protein
MARKADDRGGLVDEEAQGLPMRARSAPASSAIRASLTSILPAFLIETPRVGCDLQ